MIFRRDRTDYLRSHRSYRRTLLGVANTLFIFVLAVGSVVGKPQTIINGRRAMVLDGRAANLTVDLGGGSIVNFHLRDQGLNPLVWGEKDASNGPRAMGHFLCLDRWGPPSDAELKNGMPFHGEAAQVEWQMVQAPSTSGDIIQAEMAASLPLGGITIRRRIGLSVNSACFVVTEQVTNVNKLGRLFNMVQHPTIGPPFLDEHTLVDANASKGFMQSSPLPNPETPAVIWPIALKNGHLIDLRHLTVDPDPNVVSFTLDEKYGWVTACNPPRGLLIGYIWSSKEYPWFNAWRHVENGKPLARGLEFGTTGLHQPFPLLVAKGKIFERPLYEYLDAGETRSKRYACFLFAIPRDYKGVARIEYNGAQLILHERRGTPGRDLKMAVHLE